MSSIVDDLVFSEPSGRGNALVMFAQALVFASLYVYIVIRGDPASARWLLFMIVGTVLSGIAESLPKDRRRAAGTLRVAAILVLVCLLATVALIPEIVAGIR